jgi:hypothetical protein
MRREQIAKRRRKPPAATPRWDYVPRRRSTRHAIDSLRPLEMDGQRELNAKKLMVFNEGPIVVLSVISQRGTVNFPMSRTDAASLSGLLAKRLAELV